MDNDEFEVNKQFADLKGKTVLIGLRNWEEYEGKIITVDNYLNIILETENGIKAIKGEKIAFVSQKE
jgi:small nuclear ribonucleoprotein (snRNP)-like protein